MGSSTCNGHGQASAMAQIAKERLHESATQIWMTLEELKKPVVSPDASESSSSSNNNNNTQVMVENVIRTLFGSCTGSAPESAPVPVPAQVPAVKPDIYTRRSSDETSEDIAFDKLFRNEHLRAEEAVSHLRAQMELRNEERFPRKVSPPNEQTSPHKFFPASSPAKKDREISVPSSPRDAPPKAKLSKSGNIPPRPCQNMSFDDSISAISANTLDDMARRQQTDKVFPRVYSDLTQDPAEKHVENWHYHARRHGYKPPMSGSPFKLTRNGRSIGTVNTKHSGGGKSSATKSTQSSQTTDFANEWQKNEASYWQDVVNEEDPAFSSEDMTSFQAYTQTRQFRKEHDAKSARDATITTASSSQYSSLGSPASRRYQKAGLGHHAHAFRNPQAMMNILVDMPEDTELGEI